MNQLPLCDLVWQFTSFARNGLFMATRDCSSDARIDSVHSGAICAEIGERLRASVALSSQRWPSDFQRLTELLDEVDRRNGAFQNAIKD
jgi:hypothetical protein